MRGSLILVRNKGFVGYLIRKVTNSYWNHVGIVEDDKTIIESTFKNGVVRTDLNDFINDSKAKKLEFALYRIKDISNEQIDTIVKFVSDRIGHKYDFFQFISLFFMFLLRVTRRIEPIDNTNKWLCSELIAEGAYQAGIKFQENIDPDNITPEDIASSDIVVRIG